MPPSLSGRTASQPQGLAPVTLFSPHTMRPVLAPLKPSPHPLAPLSPAAAAVYKYRGPRPAALHSPEDDAATACGARGQLKGTGPRGEEGGDSSPSGGGRRRPA